MVRTHDLGSGQTLAKPDVWVSRPLFSGTCLYMSEFCREADFGPGVVLTGVKLPTAPVGLGEWEGHPHPPESCLTLRNDPRSFGANPLLLAICPQCTSSGLC